MTVRTYRRHLPAITAFALLAAVCAIAFLLARGADAPSRLQMLLGRLHPLSVHLPIGFLLLACALESISRLPHFRRARYAIPLVLALCAVSAVGAVLAGYLLAAAGGYGGPTILWHKRLGIGVAVAAVAALALWHVARVKRLPWLRRAYQGSLLSAVGLMIAAAHLGGNLSRGPDYLTEYLPSPLRAAFAWLPGERPPAAGFSRLDEARIYADLVRPVLEARCASCHGPDMQKGSLRLDSPEGILKGGRSGHTVVAGRPDESELVRRLWLPAGHKEVMPPRGRKPLSVVEADLLRWWIEEGASFERTIAEVTPPPSVLAILEQIAGPPEARIAPVLHTRIVVADPAAIENASAAGLTIEPIADGSGFLRARCRTSADACGSTQVEALLPLAEQITVLDLRGTVVTDQDLTAVGRLRHLTRLNLARTPVTDAGLRNLEGLEHLEYLNLYGTAITDAGLERLAGLKNLRSIFLWQTATSAAGVERLRAERVTLKVDLGLPPAALDSLHLAARRDSVATRAAADAPRSD